MCTFTRPLSFADIYIFQLCFKFSPCREGYSTETALALTLGNISSIDKREVCLDLSSAFDAVDHRLLLFRLSKSLGVSSTTLNLLTSYFVNRCQQVDLVGLHSLSQS